MQPADSQGASFRYALSTNEAPQYLVARGVSSRQLAGAVAAGWDPSLDVRANSVGSPPTGHAWCSKVLAKLAIPKASNAEWIALMHGDAVQLLLTAGRRVVGDLSRSSLVAGLGAVDAIPSANTWSASITAEHRWAVSGYRLNRYDEACGCFSCTRKQLHPV